MAGRSDDLSLTSALIALLLELLHKSGSDLLLGDDYALAFAFGAGLNVLGVVATASAAVRADNFAVVLDVE